jgi:hypothetical protein
MYVAKDLGLFEKYGSTPELRDDRCCACDSGASLSIRRAYRDDFKADRRRASGMCERRKVLTVKLHVTIFGMDLQRGAHGSSASGQKGNRHRW